jgi:hypothetical protein
MGIPVLAYLSVRGGDLARVAVAGDALIVRPHGLNRLWALKGEVRVPLLQVSQVRTEVPRGSVASGLRAPGTYIPRLIQAGTYRRKGEKSFWLVGRARNVTVIDCRGGAFARIVLELSVEAAEELQRAAGSQAS